MWLVAVYTMEEIVLGAQVGCAGNEQLSSLASECIKVYISLHTQDRKTLWGYISKPQNLKLCRML